MDNNEEAIKKTKELFEQLPQSLKDFLEKNATICTAWAKTHGNTNFPIFKDELTDTWHWIPRAARRRAFRTFKQKNGKKVNNGT